MGGSLMKGYHEILLILRPDRALCSESILLEEGAEFVTRQTVHGRGKEMGLKLLPSWFGSRRKSSPYIRKAMLSALVPAKNLSRIIKKLVRMNRTKKFGDGKIFIMPCIDDGGF